MTNISDLMGLADAAAELGVDRETVRRWVHAGMLRGAKAPGGIRAPYMVDRRDVAALAAERATAVAS